MNDEQELEIIGRILNGDREAYSALVDRYKGPVFDLAYRMTGTYHEAEDLAQEAFVKAYETLKGFRKEKRLFPWIYTIALNLIRNHLKKRLREMPVTASDPYLEAAEEKTHDPEHDTIIRQEIEMLSRCMQTLPPDLREAVILRCYQDLSFEEVSEILGISLGATKMRVYRGLERLRAEGGRQ